ncbi:WxL domain-containing protein, partial [Enterococcus faecalis]
LMSWGDSVDTAKTSISLEVPGSTTKYAKKYTTTFTWTLTDTPANTGN